jgi:hypothetical protein
MICPDDLPGRHDRVAHLPDRACGRPLVERLVENRARADVAGDDERRARRHDDGRSRPAGCAGGQRDQDRRQPEGGHRDGDDPHAHVVEVTQHAEHHRPQQSWRLELVGLGEPQDETADGDRGDDDRAVDDQPATAAAEERGEPDEQDRRHHGVVVAAVDDLVGTPPPGHEHDRQADQR